MKCQNFSYLFVLILPKGFDSYVEFQCEIAYTFLFIAAIVMNVVVMYVIKVCSTEAFITTSTNKKNCRNLVPIKILVFWTFCLFPHFLVQIQELKINITKKIEFVFFYSFCTNLRAWNERRFIESQYFLLVIHKNTRPHSAKITLKSTRLRSKHLCLYKA